MKETMYSGVDTAQDNDVLIWVKGDVMAVSIDNGAIDPWRNPHHELSLDIHGYLPKPTDLDRFTDLSVVWERG